MKPDQPESLDVAEKPVVRTASILVVDDVSANLQVLTGMLKARGYKVRPAPSGKLALLAARKHPPDLILARYQHARNEWLRGLQKPQGR